MCQRDRAVHTSDDIVAQLIVKSGCFLKIVSKFKESQSKIESAVLKRQIWNNKILEKGYNKF